jgi:4,4'-diaponeurosporenoate glycosyltransferase
VAFGPVLACRRSDYVKAGGHESIASEVLDDATLAGRFRSVGLSVLLMGGGKAITFRMYPRGIAQMVEGFTKNFAAGARRTNPLVMAAVAFWLSGVIAAPFRGWLRYGLYAAQIAVLLPKVGRFRWWVPAFYPAPLVVFLGVFVRSLVLLVTGRPAKWKGRDVGGRGGLFGGRG